MKEESHVGPIERRMDRMRAIESTRLPVDQVPGEPAKGPRCGTCGRRTWRWISLDGAEARASARRLGPGDPWLPGQSEAERATFVPRSIAAAQAADLMEAATGVRL